MTEHVLFDSKKFIFFTDVPRLDATSAIIRTSNLIEKLARIQKKENHANPHSYWTLLLNIKSASIQPSLI